MYCKATIFSELRNLTKLAMTHETLNLLALNVRSKSHVCSWQEAQCRLCAGFKKETLLGREKLTGQQLQ